MSYEFTPNDAYSFSRQNGRRADVQALRPFCKGGSHGDKYTFSVSLRTGQYNCLQGSCGGHGGFVTLAKAFHFAIDLGTKPPMKKEYKKTSAEKNRRYCRA